MEGKVEVKIKAAIVKQIEVATTIYIERLMTEAKVEYIQITNVIPFDSFNQLSYQLITSSSIIY